MNRLQTLGTKVMKGTSAAMLTLSTIAMNPAGALNVFAAEAGKTGEVNLDNVTSPIIGLLSSVLTALIPLVGAVGAVYCVLLGVKFAKAEEPQEREKAKAHLRNAIIGFVLIFVLVVALKQLEPIMTSWMTTNMSTTSK